MRLSAFVAHRLVCISILPVLSGHTLICGYTEPLRRRRPTAKDLQRTTNLLCSDCWDAHQPLLSTLIWTVSLWGSCDTFLATWTLPAGVCWKHSSVRVAAHLSAALDNDVIDNSSSCLTCETCLQRHILIVLLPSNPSHLALWDAAKPMLDMETLTEQGISYSKRINKSQGWLVRGFIRVYWCHHYTGCFHEQNGFRVWGGN